MGRDLSRDSDGKKALNRQIIIVCYLQFVVKKHAFGLGTEPQEGQGNYTGG
jgi:hypothetical protein